MVNKTTTSYDEKLHIELKIQQYETFVHGTDLTMN